MEGAGGSTCGSDRAGADVPQGQRTAVQRARSRPIYRDSSSSGPLSWSTFDTLYERVRLDRHATFRSTRAEGGVTVRTSP